MSVSTDHRYTCSRSNGLARFLKTNMYGRRSMGELPSETVLDRRWVYVVLLIAETWYITTANVELMEM